MNDDEKRKRKKKFEQSNKLISEFNLLKVCLDFSKVASCAIQAAAVT